MQLSQLENPTLTEAIWKKCENIHQEKLSLLFFALLSVKYTAQFW